MPNFMNLPFFKKKSSAESREYLFALEIGHEAVKTAIWSVVNKKTQVLSIGDPVLWDESKPDELITACDKSLSDATTKFDSTGQTQPQKIILGLPSDWIVSDKISSEKLKSLKEITHKLSLTAIGFVVTPQAIVRHLHHVEGVPPTAILIGFGQSQLEVTLVRLGRAEATHQVKRSSNIAEDVIEGLYRFGRIDMLPSRILIYDVTKDLEDIRQQLLAYPWQAPQTKLSFLHFPKIEALPSDFSIKAISLSGGSEVAQAIGLIPPEPIAETPVIAPASTDPVSPEDLGFTSDVSASSVPETVVPPEKPRVFKSRPKFQIPKFSLPKIPLLPVFIIVFFIALLGLFVAYWFLPRASVDLIVKTQNLNLEIDLPLSTQTVEETVTADQEKSTTGTKLIGDKATGEVSVINGTSSSKKFPAGTIITSPAGLKFSFDSEVSIASASGTADPNSYQPGKANVKVTAAGIGSDSNLSAGTQFQLGSYSSLDFISRNDTAFTGGSSRQVAAVSKEDLSSLKSQLLDSLKSQSKDKLVSKLSDTQKLIDSSVTTLISSENYSAKVDETADKIKLTLTLKSHALSYDQTELNDQILSEFTPKIPEGYKLLPDFQTELNLKTSKDDKTTVSVKANALLSPVIDTAVLVKLLVGKTPQKALSVLESQPNIQEVSFTFTPKLPEFLRTFPRISDHISVAVRTQP